MAETLPLIIAYDIASPKRWRKLHKLLAAEAFALQYSVFAADWTETRLAAMLQTMTAIINAEEDDVRVFRVPLSARGFRHGEWRGTGTTVLALGSPVLALLEGLDGSVKSSKRKLEQNMKNKN